MNKKYHLIEHDVQLIIVFDGLTEISRRLYIRVPAATTIAEAISGRTRSVGATTGQASGRGGLHD